MSIRLAMALAGMGLAAALPAFAQDKPQPAAPDPEYCAKRDADPRKCVIQDGPPKATVRKPPPTSPKRQAEKARWKSHP